MRKSADTSGFFHPWGVLFLSGVLIFGSGCSKSAAPPSEPVASHSGAVPVEVPLQAEQASVSPPPPPPGTASPSPPPAPGGMGSSADNDPLEIDSEEGFAVVIADVQEGVEAYFDEKEVKPTSLQQVIQAGFLTKLPALPPGKAFHLNPETLEVSVR